MERSIKEVIKNRTSTRTFEDKSLWEADLSRVREYLAEVKNPFDIPVEFRLLNAKEKSLSSPVIVNAEWYFAAKVKKVPGYEIAYGYSFEDVCLFAESIGLGAVMLAASLSRATFEKAMELEEGEVMPLGSPIGYPSKKRSVRESLMRKGLKADDRISFDKLFFEGNFSKGLSKANAGEFAEALEMTRLAPSAANKQPWRAVISEGKVHFYEHKSMKENPEIDIQKVDIGIALAHFDMTMKENGVEGRFVFEDPGITCPEGTEYIVTYMRV